MRSKTTITLAVGLGLAFCGVGFAQSTTATTTTERPDGQKSRSPSIKDPSAGRASDSTTIQHSDSAKTTNRTDTSKTERSDYK